jgi:hypothetical protein
MTVLGQVSRRFIVSPDIDCLLDEMDRAETRAKEELLRKEKEREASLKGAIPMEVD